MYGLHTCGRSFVLWCSRVCQSGQKVWPGPCPIISSLWRKKFAQCLTHITFEIPSPELRHTQILYCFPLQELHFAARVKLLYQRERQRQKQRQLTWSSCFVLSLLDSPPFSLYLCVSSPWQMWVEMGSILTLPHNALRVSLLRIPTYPSALFPWPWPQRSYPTHNPQPPHWRSSLSSLWSISCRLGLYRQDPYVATYNLPTATFSYIFLFKYHFKKQCELNRIEYRIL